MNFSFASLVAATTLTTVDASASSKWSNLRRYLSYEKVAGYAPGSQVTDHCAIDRDQAALEAELAKKTPEAFENALRIYKEGGNSKSYAQVTLTTPLSTFIGAGTVILGRNAEGNEVAGKAYEDYQAGTSVIKIQYATTDIQETYVECQVGALAEADRNLSGCFVDQGDLTIDGQEFSYIYVPKSDNLNGRTIAGFSTEARDKMRVGCKGCPYQDFMYFYDYYGSDTYAHDWVTAAFAGDKTSFKNGNADFSQYGMDGKEQIIKKGTAYLNIFMYVIREFEDALDDCQRGCINCNDDPVHAWDEGVCFYTGSIEGQDGAGDGSLLHQLADKRCADYKTCGVDGTDLEGMAMLNYELFDLFALGNFQLQSGNCPAARDTTKRVTQKMYIPMIQGAMRYAYKMEKLQGDEKEAAEGAAFAAAVLPRIYAASPEAAQTIYNNLRVGASSTDSAAVKSAFESVYPALGIICGEMGGLWNEAEKSYYSGMEPCQDVLTRETETVVKNNNTLAIALGCTFGALFAVAAAFILYIRKREKRGEMTFETWKTAEQSAAKGMN
eukprot:CAMPEP_0171358864 /NCGR_PEP_ID=MMETSP0879-20121228/261_1 /TAXON_ID=67004 /ORGANISM="Thalassiosira weissflogii, Strain CCMP1336" /LENGTH=553 /DNA_ID=CAMNT_0011864979 /DNA_START=241 /DNA_END=1902 /DNA_ORIENTATION=-